MDTSKCPDKFTLWTPDEVAECVSGITPETYRKLWMVLESSTFTKRPLGGDGSDGTTEVPDDFSGSMEDAWPLLDDEARQNIVEAAAKED